MASISPTPHPLDAIPVRSEGIEQVRHPSEGSLLRLALTPQGVIHRWMARWMGRQELRVILDLQGSLYWEQIDDQRTLAEISRRMASQLDISEADSRRACTAYTADLVKRGFLHLSIPAPSHE